MKLNQLSIQDLEGLFFKIYENACELIDEAELLYKHQKYARSYLCSHSAFEEFGKIPMLHRAAIDIHMGEKVDWKSLNKRIRSHMDKISLSSLTIFYFDSLIKQNDTETKLQNLRSDIDPLDANYIEGIKEIISGIPVSKEGYQRYISEMDIKSVMDSKNEMTVKLKNYREGSLYADFENTDFLKPSERIDREICEYGYTITYLQKQFIDAPKFHINGFKFDDNHIEQTSKLILELMAKQLDGFTVKE